MSEGWPFLLISGYFITLIYSFFKQPTRLGEEIKYFSWYLVIGLISALYAHETYLNAMYPPCTDCPPADINILGIFRKLWYVVVWPYSLAFALLSMMRHLIMLAIYGWKQRSKRQVAEKTA